MQQARVARGWAPADAASRQSVHAIMYSYYALASMGLHKPLQRAVSRKAHPLVSVALRLTRLLFVLAGLRYDHHHDANHADGDRRVRPHLLFGLLGHQRGLVEVGARYVRAAAAANLKRRQRRRSQRRVRVVPHRRYASYFCLFVHMAWNKYFSGSAGAGKPKAEKAGAATTNGSAATDTPTAGGATAEGVRRRPNKATSRAAKQ